MKKQNKILPFRSYKKAITTLLVLLCSFAHSLNATESPQSVANQLLDTPYLYQSVNVITGDYCEANTDFISPSSPQSKIRRCFSNGEGWNFNLPLIKNAEKNPDEKSSPFLYTYDSQDRLLRVDHKESKTALLNITYQTSSTTDAMTFKINEDTLSYEFTPSNSRLGIPPFLLTRFCQQDQELCRYQYRPHPHLRKQLLERKDESNGNYCINEYYDKKNNEVGDVNLVIEDPVRDFRIGRVKLQRGPNGISDTSVITARYFYYPDYTEVFDALNRKTIYRYQVNRLTAIENYLNDTLYRTERFYWEKDAEREEWNLKAKAWEDGQGTVVKCFTYTYDKQGNQISESLHGQLSGRNTVAPILNCQGVVVNGPESYSKYKCYTTTAPYRLLSESEDNGKTISYRYDEATGLKIAEFTSNVSVVLQRRFFQYDKQKRLTAIIMDDGHSEDPQDLHNMTERHATVFTYSENAPYSEQPITTEEQYFDLHSGNYVTTRRTTLSYNKNQKLQSKQVFNSDNTLAATTTFSYDDLGRLTKEIDGTGNGYEKTFDVNGNLLSHILFENNNQLQETTYTYDKTGRLVATSRYDDQGNSDSHTYQYNQAGEKIASSDRFGNTTTYNYDSLGRLTVETPPLVFDGQNHLLAPTIRYAYDILNHLTEVTDPNGFLTTTLFTAYGKPYEKTYPDGAKEYFFYHLDGSLSEMIDKKNISTRYERDIFGRETFVEVIDANSHIRLSLASTYSTFHLIKTIKDGKLTSYYSYTPQGKIASKEQHFLEGIQRVEFSYDKAGRVDTQTESWGTAKKEILVTKYTYNPQGNLLKTALYDQTGTLLKETPTQETSETSANTQESATVNEQGQTVRQTFSTNAYGQTTILTYDVLGRVSTLLVKDSLGQVIKHLGIGYDPAGNKIKETVFDNNFSAIVKTNLYHYDSCNRLKTAIEAAETTDARITRYYYNTSGQIEQIVKPNGVSINHLYSALGQLKDYYASDFSFKYHFIYDDQGLLVKVENVLEHTYTNRKFNTFGQIIYEELGNGLRLNSTYDAIGRKTHLTLPDNSSVAYHYDALYLRTIERFSQNNQLQYSHSYPEYNLQGMVTKVNLLGNCGLLYLSYNDKNICNSIISSQWSQQIPDNGMDAFGNIIALEGSDTHGFWHSTFSYSNNQELIKETGAFDNDFTYDENSNRESANDDLYLNNLLNQLYALEKANETINYTYDLNGNLIEKSSATQTTSYHYDALDRLLSIEINHSIAIHFTYDAFYRRLSKTLSKWDDKTSQWIVSKTWHYIYDGNREIGAVDHNKNLLELRILGSSLVGGNQHSEIGSAIAHEINGKIYAPIHDHRGNVGCLIDSESGAIAESYRYSAFGETTIYSEDGNALKKSGIKNPWQFSSKRLDTETGFIYYGKRYYDPTNGRWTSKDPLGLFDGDNPYIFLHQNPLSQIDLYGLFSFSSAWQGVKEMAGSVANALVDFKEKASYTNYMQKDWDHIAEQFLGKGFLQFSGYYSHPIESGRSSFGEETDDKVRITLINGILNVRYDLEEAMKLFSSTHGNMPIHYVYRPTEGWTKDILTSTLSKFGFTSPYAKLLAQTWKEMIEEMGGVGQGGKIIHYAHSIGATDTYVARNLLTPEEQQMIHVITLGSPTMIPNDSGFASVINYVSKRDGVCLLDPIGYATGYFYGKSNIELIGSLWGIPLIDHTLYTDSYGGVIQELGKQFVGIYQ